MDKRRKAKRSIEVALSNTNSEAWRYRGRFTRWNRFKAGFPGLGIATVAFAAYCGYEHFFLKGDDHGHGHGEEHH